MLRACSILILDIFPGSFANKGQKFSSYLERVFVYFMYKKSKPAKLFFMKFVSFIEIVRDTTLLVKVKQDLVA